MVLQGLVPSFLGIVAGLAGAFALAQMMGSLVHAVSVTDPPFTYRPRSRLPPFPDRDVASRPARQPRRSRSSCSADE